MYIDSNSCLFKCIHERVPLALESVLFVQGQPNTHTRGQAASFLLLPYFPSHGPLLYYCLLCFFISHCLLYSQRIFSLFFLRLHASLYELAGEFVRFYVNFMPNGIVANDADRKKCRNWPEIWYTSTVKPHIECVRSDWTRPHTIVCE